MGLTLTATEVTGVGPVLVAVGHMNGNHVPELQEALEAELRAGRIRLVLDCAGVLQMSSTGLGSLVKYADALRARGGGISLVGVTAKIRIVLDMLDLVRCFDAVRADRPGPVTRATSRLTLTRRPSGKPGVALLEAVGVIDARTSLDELEAFKEAALRGDRDVVVDCAGLRAIEGAGLDKLIGVARSFDDLGGSVALLGVSSEVKAALEVGGLERAFTVVCKDRPVVAPAP